MIGIMPIGFYVYMVFPAVQIWETPFFTFTSHYYEDVNTFVWTFFQKFVPLCLIIIWYVTCRHWWSKVILIPISTIVVQILILFNDDIQFKDEIDGLFATPFVLITIFSLYYLRRKIKYYTEVLNLGDQLQIVKKRYGLSES